MTRFPANPTNAPGSARIISPKKEKLALTPPVVGFVKTLINNPELLLYFAMAADVFAICIKAMGPSCIRAPPDVANIIIGIFFCSASSNAITIFSPTTIPILPIIKRLSITASITSIPLILH